jgi:hypothetical protein
MAPTVTILEEWTEMVPAVPVVVPPNWILVVEAAVPKVIPVGVVDPVVACQK